MSKRMFSFCSLLAMIVICFSCSFGHSLSNEEAHKIISDHFPPKPLNVMFFANADNNPNIIKGIQKLIADGFVRRNPNTQYTEGPDYYVPTDKGRQHIVRIGRSGNLYAFNGSVCSEVVKKIDEVLLDKKTNSAIVAYTLGIEPIQPIYYSVCIDNSCPYYGLKESRITKVKLHRYDKGWRVQD